MVRILDLILFIIFQETNLIKIIKVASSSNKIINIMCVTVQIYSMISKYFLIKIRYYRNLKE